MKRFYRNVTIGKNCIIEDGAEIGRTGVSKKALKTIIGDNCHIRRGTIIYAGTTIGNNITTGHFVLIREDNVIGDNVVIGSYTELGLRNTIGDNGKIHSRCFFEDVTLERDVFVGPGVIFANDPHPSSPQFRSCFRGATVGQGAMIGAGVTVLPWVKIGEHSLVGAGSVVTKNVPPRAVVVGNPAVKIKNVLDITCHRMGKPHRPYAKDPYR